MQENRSFDHCFGTLKGVRGFNDPRALKMEDGRPVFLQRNSAGETYAPFRLNIKDTKATWMSALPHSWSDQVDARNGGKHDRWLDVKHSGNREYSRMPLTMGYYNREDLPFYYALADAFTVCDQHFCSSLTGTTPNRLYFWTGTIRREPKGSAKANVWNSDVDYGREADWKTFPEVLEANGVSWKIYQNEISAGVGFEGEQDAWLANFTDNPIEWFSQYHVEYSEAHQRYLQKLLTTLPEKIAAEEQALAKLAAGSKEHSELEKMISRRRKALEKTKEVLDKIGKRPFNTLPAHEQQLHKKAFTTNVNDPDYHQLSTLQYNDGTVAREMQLPKGDVLHQFRQDVKNGQLPTVSWIVAPENFSDHPGAPWYGAWYLSEVMDILTHNPEVWKKTIFILTYDENDGYFDHVPPFVAPQPGESATGKVSAGIDTDAEFVMRHAQAQGSGVRESAIGLGYRVPMVVASPWTRGGFVNSQVFDHTSNLQFLERFLGHKLKKQITTDNITSWRRTVCGDLTSIFRPWNGEKIPMPASVNKTAFMESVHKARFKNPPANFRILTAGEVKQITAGAASSAMPQQEPGIRPSCAIPYELYADAALTPDRKSLSLQLQAGNTLFGRQAAGAPFNAYTKTMANRSYAVVAGDRLTDEWVLDHFPGGKYALSVYGPNGFFREFTGDAQDPQLDIAFGYDKKGALVIQFTAKAACTIHIQDRSYKEKPAVVRLVKGGKQSLNLPLTKSYGWYDLSITVEGAPHFERRYAGHVETGSTAFTDPLMGRMV